MRKVYSGANAVNEEDPEPERYTGVEDFQSFRHATFLRETRPYPSWLRYCMSEVVSTSASDSDLRAFSELHDFSLSMTHNSRSPAQS